MFYFDPLYFIILAPGLLLAAWAQMKVKLTYAHANQIPSNSGITGRDAAHMILRANGISGVDIEVSQGMLSDHYDPVKKVLRLSPDVYGGHSLSAVGIAAHEVGHAIQDAQRYKPLVIRNGIVPMANIGSNLSWFLMLGGFAMGSLNLIMWGIIAFSLVVIFQLVNLPVEFDASNRARTTLIANGIISPGEEKEVAKVLNAAALTYVAATITAILTLLYYLIRSGLLGGRRE